MKAGQAAEDTFPSDVAEKAVKGTGFCKMQLFKKKLGILAAAAIIIRGTWRRSGHPLYAGESSGETTELGGTVSGGTKL